MLYNWYNLIGNRIIYEQRSLQGGGLMDNKRHQRLAKCRISIYQIGNLKDFIYTFGFIRSGEGDLRAVVEMDYIASEELDHLIRRGFVLDVHFTYVVRSVQHSTILPNLRLFNVPSMTYATTGPWPYPGTGLPTLTSAIAAAK